MVKKLSSDSDWEKLGQTDPYFGVCTDEAFKTSNLTEEALQAFFKSGQEHISYVLDKLRWLSGKQIQKLDSVLDFGCGTGRLLIPLSAVAEQAVGIDVSGSVLKEAQRNINKLSISNIKLVQSNSLDVINGKAFDLVHTYIVLQHIPVKAGYRIIDALLKAIRPGGLGMIHITYRNENKWLKNIGIKLKSNYKFIAQLSNVLKGRPMRKPSMQMNNYNLRKVLTMMEALGIKKFYTEFTDHGGCHGVSIYIEKEQS